MVTDELQIFGILPCDLLALQCRQHTLSSPTPEELLWMWTSSRSFWNLQFSSSVKKGEKKSQLTWDSSPRTILRSWEFGILVNSLNINLSYLLPCFPASITPSRKRDIASGAVRALIAGTIACFMTACIAGTASSTSCPVSLCPQDGSFQGLVPSACICSICCCRKLRGRAAVKHIVKWNAWSMVGKLGIEGEFGDFIN